MSPEKLPPELRYRLVDVAGLMVPVPDGEEAWDDYIGSLADEDEDEERITE